MTVFLILLLALSIACNVPFAVLLAAYCWRLAARQPVSPDLGGPDRLPPVLIQLPAFNEGDVIVRAAQAAAAQDWPRDRLRIQILDDSTDGTPAAAARAVEHIRAAGTPIELLHRDHREGFKAGALQAGLDRDPAPFVAILDADYVPAPGWLRSCMAVLLANEDLAFVQSRIDFLNRDATWFTRGQAAILDNHYVVEQGGRDASGLVVPFNGTCGVWRRRAIDAVGGWSGDTLVEDMDLSFRAEAAGWRGRYLPRVSVPGELPASIRDWAGQQRRWSMGTAQIVRRTLRGLFGAGTALRLRLSYGYQFLNMFAAQVSVLAVAGGLAWWSAVRPDDGVFVTMLLAALALVVLRIFLSPLIALAATRGFRPGAIALDIPCSILVVLFGLWTNTAATLRGLAGRRAVFVRTRKTGAVS